MNSPAPRLQSHQVPVTKPARKMDRQTLALRKKQLLVRAALERVECLHAGCAFSEAFSTKLKAAFWIRQLFQRRYEQYGLNRISSLLRPYPLLSTVVSLVLIVPVKIFLLRRAKPLTKWFALGTLIYKVLRRRQGLSN
jgi:hypothetical protein